METKPSSYHPITPELAASGLLITIKQAAADEKACESTLRNNAKTRRLPAYQAHFGAPVMVKSEDVRKFLKSRPDISSKYHTTLIPAVPAAGHPPSTETAVCKNEEILPFPLSQAAPLDPIGNLGMSINLRSLNHTQSTELTLVANCLLEIARQIEEIIAFQARR